MALFINSAAARRPRRRSQAGPPHPVCHCHGGVPIGTKYRGTSRIQGTVVHHFRCPLDASHHWQFVFRKGRWHRLIDNRVKNAA